MPTIMICIQPGSGQENDIVNCIKLMVNYGIEFGETSQNTYSPEINKLFIGLQTKAIHNNLSNSLRLTMSSHYKQIK
jgi:hypothetical protein